MDPLIQCDARVPSKREARVALTQFLTLCWTLFTIGWTVGSTGPLLPRIQTFYDVSWPIGGVISDFQRLYYSGWVWKSVLDICFAAHRQ